MDKNKIIQSNYHNGEFIVKMDTDENGNYFKEEIIMDILQRILDGI